MMGTPHLCVFYVATAGLQGNALGSDEEEIVLLIYVVIDMSLNKVVGVQQYVVKPTVADINENVLSEQLIEESALTEELVKNAGQPLGNAIRQFDMYIRSLQIDPDSPLFRFVTDGQLPLRQCLHPEVCSKNIELPSYYYMFHDLRKDFRAFYNAPPDQELNSITDLVNYLGMPHDLDSDFYIKETKDMVNIVLRLIADGHCFSAPETIDDKLEPGICSKNEEVDNNCVVRARGLPWQSSDQDIAKFFRGLNVAKGGVALCLSPQGRRNGEALVRFVSQEHRDMALKRHKHHIGNRYIEVYKASGEDFINVAGGNNNEAQAFLTRGAQVIIRMRGLPYDCTAKQVIEFFENACTVMDGEEGVLFVKKPDGRATGDAFVLFAREEDSAKALSKHRELIGTRYIELFRSTTAEVQQVLNRSMDPKTFEPLSPLIAQIPQVQVPQVPLLPQHIITSGTRKDCIRLRGLPYEAQVEHILEFLGDHAKNIVFQGVHMVYNAQGQPSGEAFIQMDSEGSAFLAAQQKHHRYMIFGKKQRYIEVFQCSGEDMNLVLTGGIPAGAVSPVAKTLLSPGMLTPPPPQPTPTTWDPIVAAAVQAQALAQIRQSQEGLWLMNQIAVAQAAQQQQQALAVAFASKQTPQWADLNGSLIPAASIPPPPVSSIPATQVTSTKPHFTFPSAQYYPTMPPPPLFLVNLPPRIPPPAHFPKIPPPPLPAATYTIPSLSIIPPPTATAAGAPQSAANIVNLKRSWEQAFPNAAAEANSAVVKRQFPPVSTSAQVYAPQTVPQPPPPQHAVAFQTTQFYSAM